MVNTLLIVALEVPLNLAMAHWSHRRALMLGMLLTAIGFGAIGLSHSVLAIAATVVIWTFGEMVTLSRGNGVCRRHRAAGPHRRVHGRVLEHDQPVDGHRTVGRRRRARPLRADCVAWSGVFVCGMVSFAVVTSRAGRSRARPIRALKARARDVVFMRDGRAVLAFA